MSRTCFVIQPFDGSAFDKRYRDVVEPAIRAAGLEPYRVDSDPTVAIPIQEIEENIRRAAICFADITIDNPNVWFELGYSIAVRKPVVLICSKDRQRFPFDVQHRNIIRYSTESPSDFDEMKNQITARLAGLLQSESELGSIASMTDIVASTEGLKPSEIAALTIIATHEKLNGFGASPYKINGDMNGAGFTEAACALALRTLEGRKLVRTVLVQDVGYEEFLGYLPTPNGWTWLESNQHLLTMRKSFEQSSLKKLSEEDLPF